MVSAKVKRVLLVSEDLVFVKSLSESLSASGYAVVRSTDKTDALRVVLEMERPDAVIIDIGMPVMDGLELSLRMRRWMDIPVILLTSWGSGKDRIRGLDLSSESYLTQPYDIREVVARVADLTN